MYLEKEGEDCGYSGQGCPEDPLGLLVPLSTGVSSGTTESNSCVVRSIWTDVHGGLLELSLMSS